MLAMLQDLIRHKAYADACLLKAIRQHEKAAQDEELRFALEEESRIPELLEGIEKLYRKTHAQELEWISQIREPDLDRGLQSPFVPDRNCSVAQALMQVCMHSHGHRSQCATRLRLLGGIPPILDFILWLKERPAADWP